MRCTQKTANDTRGLCTEFRDANPGRPYGAAWKSYCAARPGSSAAGGPLGGFQGASGEAREGSAAA